MAAPSATARGTPAGIRLTDGHPTKVTFASNPTVSLWEISVKPPTFDGGEPIDITTMHNVTVKTKAHQNLIDVMDGSFKFAYDPNLVNQILSLVNVDDTVTVTYRDGSTEAFFAFMQKVEFDEIERGKMPTGTATICPSNMDASRTEQVPVLTSVAGT